MTRKDFGYNVSLWRDLLDTRTKKKTEHQQKGGSSIYSHLFLSEVIRKKKSKLPVASISNDSVVLTFRECPERFRIFPERFCR